MSATAESGTAAVQGDLWGARAAGWAAQEPRETAKYEEALARVHVGPGVRVLDIGCGSGVFLRMAADRGAEVAGLDAAGPLIELARARVPEAELVVGEMEALPFADDSFDLVTAFNSLFFAADITNAAREAARVAKPGATVVIQVWGDPARCELMSVLRALGPLRPERPAPSGPGLFEPGVLESIAEAAGLRPDHAFDAVTTFDYDSEREMCEGIMSAGGIVEAIRHSGEEAVRSALVEAAAPFRDARGGYSFANEWHYLVARA